MIYPNLFYKSKSKAFSLIELSIAIIIISLLIFVVSSADNLKSQAKLTKIIQEFQAIEADIYSFKTTYNALPGDMTNAYNYWQNECANIADNCNGNGDRLINYNTDGNDDIESFRAWQHLQLADIKSDFYATGTSLLGEAIIGSNIPTSAALESLGYTILNADYSVHYYANYIVLGAAKSGEYANGGGLTSLQAYHIDKKIDDTHPLKGNYLTFYDTVNNCQTDATNYDLSNANTTYCWSAFKLP